MSATWWIAVLGLLALGSVIPSIRRRMVWCVRLADEHDGFMTFLATVAIAVLTYFLVVISNSQGLTLQKQFDASRTPVVSAGNKDGKLGELTAPSKPDNKEGVVLFFHNGGQGPALYFNVQLFNWTGPTENQHMARLADESGIPIVQMGHGISIPPDSDRRVIFDGWIPEADAEAVRNGHGKGLVGGLFEYCDLMGNYTCQQFFGRY
jgi:hypothetical protein